MLTKTPEDLYNYINRRIRETDKEINYLNGKREAYNDIKLEMYSMIEETKDDEQNQ